ncbi:UNVERIFIED_CONTAM: hypothetical protein K2H54_006250 [Gekko kuhli]
MEQIVFPVPNICEFLTHESKYRVFNTTERDEQGSKVNDFFQQTEDLYNEMKWQKKIRRCQPPTTTFLPMSRHLPDSKVITGQDWIFLSWELMLPWSRTNKTRCLAGGMSAGVTMMNSHLPAHVPSPA